VSPGSPSDAALVEARCPAFSWAEVAGARSYELVVYQIDEDGEEPGPVLRQSFAGSVSSWTPSLDRCLERGGRYAWSLRAIGKKNPSAWSSPSLFEVASGPSEAEFEEALRVVRQYLATEAADDTRGAGEEEATSETEGTSAASPEPLPPPPGTQLSVDGNVDATSFSGDGSALANVDADQLDGEHASGFALATHPHTTTARESTETASTSADADCETHEIVTGGGCRCDDAPMAPSGGIQTSTFGGGLGPGWSCVCGGPSTVTATVICLAVGAP